MKHIGYTLSLLAIYTGSFFTVMDHAIGQEYIGNLCCGEQIGDPCNTPRRLPPLSVGGELIYWKACVNDLEIASVSESVNENRTGEYIAISPDWKPGFRVFLGLDNPSCCYGLKASYTNMKADGSKKVVAVDQINSSLLNPGFALNTPSLADEVSSHWNSRYHEADLLFSYEVCFNKCHHFTPYAGVAGINFKQTLKTSFFTLLSQSVTSKVSLSWKSRYWGAGLRAGSHYTCQLVKYLSFFAGAHVTLLAGEPHTTLNGDIEFSNESTVPMAQFKDSKNCLFVSGYHIQLGFESTRCFCDVDCSFRVGYEFVQWHNLPRQRVYPNQTTIAYQNASLPNGRTLGFHGLLAGASICF